MLGIFCLKKSPRESCYVPICAMSKSPLLAVVDCCHPEGCLPSTVSTCRSRILFHQRTLVLDENCNYRWVFDKNYASNCPKIVLGSDHQSQVLILNLSNISLISLFGIYWVSKPNKKSTHQSLPYPKLQTPKLGLAIYQSLPKLEIST